MPLPTQPHPELDAILADIGEAGARLDHMGAVEGAAGNISVLLGWPVDLQSIFPNAEPLDLPAPAPALSGYTVIVSGSGRRLRDIGRDPAANLGAVVVGEGGLTGTLYTSPRRAFERVTSEFNSHLAVHNDQAERTGSRFHVLVHAQPPHLVYLSHIPAYREGDTLNKRLVRWEPETIVQLPRGICVLPYLLPGSPAMMQANIEGLREYAITLWTKHGLMARSSKSVMGAVDLIEYIETAARYEYMDLAAGGQAEGLTPEEIREVARTFSVQTDLL